MRTPKEVCGGKREKAAFHERCTYTYVYMYIYIYIYIYIHVSIISIIHSKREKNVFHEYLQEACFVLTEISENLRKPPGVYGIM